MTRWFVLDRREKAILFAGLYLAGLYISTTILWWVAVMGGNPFTIENMATLNKQGVVESKFRAGDVVGVHRRICSDRAVGMEFFPALRDPRGVIFPLPDGLVQVERGCAELTNGFIVPDLPPGDYIVVSTIRYQTNLVGRDEHLTFPELHLRIMRKRKAADASEPETAPDQ